MEQLQCGLVELKLATGGADEMTFSGYGAVFNNVDLGGDLIAPGAFADSLAEIERTGVWPAMLLQHAGGFLGGSAEDLSPIGVWTELAEDGKGLKVAGKLAPTPRGRDVHALMKMTPRPALNGLSIGYQAKEWVMGTKPSEPRRTLKKVKLLEISPVTFPMNPKARVEAVKAIEGIESLADAERYLRDACGLSRRDALAFVSRVKGLNQRDSDGLLLSQTWMSAYRASVRNIQPRKDR